MRATVLALEGKLKKALAGLERESRWRLKWEGEAAKLREELRAAEQKRKDVVYRLQEELDRLRRARRAAW